MTSCFAAWALFIALLLTELQEMLWSVLTINCWSLWRRGPETHRVHTDYEQVHSVLS